MGVNTVTMTTSAPELLVLRGELAVHREAWGLLLDLEYRGMRLHVDPLDDKVVRGPCRLLTNDDKQAIARHRDALKALILCCEAIH
jgi:hypothetical protein